MKVIFRTMPSLILRHVGWVFLGILWAGLSAIVPAAAANEPGLIAQGQYLARLGDCMACHTRPGGAPFAGGLPINTPFGTVMTTNLTPDSDTGIGGWSDDAFYRAVTDGIGRQGEYLYPAMPFTSFTKMTRSDVLAIKAYLFSLKPAHAPAQPNSMMFPIDIRSTLLLWRVLFFHPGTYRPDPTQTAEWNRGAYLIEGPGHCGECHSPRNIFGATVTQSSLAGGKVENWLAPNISGDPRWGVGGWSVNDIVTFLKTGSHQTEGVAFGPMAQVVHDSLSYVSIADLQAMAVFLKSGPGRIPDPALQVSASSDLQHGQTLYRENCAKCHQEKGQGFSSVIPNLAKNAAVNSAEPNDIINAILIGVPTTGTYGWMPSFAKMLSDQDISDITNYVRSDWGNNAPTNATPALAASLRSKASAAGQK